jgi:hypothetical protein
MAFTSTRERRTFFPSKGWPLLALLALFFQTAAGAADSQPSCRRVALDPSPSWLSAATWSGDGRQLVLVDAAGSRLLRYTDGKYSGEVKRPGMGALEFNDPIGLQSIPEGFLLTNYPGRFIWLDRSFQPLRSMDFLKIKPGGKIHQKFESFSLKDPRLTGNSLLGFTILHLDDKPWQGFVRGTLNPFELTDLIEEVNPKSPEDRLFRLLPPESAPAGNDDYVLRWAQPTYILQVWPQKRRLKAFPPGFEALPTLPEGVGGMAAGPTLYKALEHSTSAAGLYGQGAYLYLLTRKPTGQGTLWQLWQIDPQRDTIVRSVILPTQTNHVVLAPGPVHWAVIEKGPVIESGKQAIKTVLLLPSSWIEDPASKVLADGNAVSCR